MHTTNVRGEGRNPLSLNVVKGKEMKVSGEKALFLLWLCIMTVLKHDFSNCVLTNLNWY